MYSIPDIGVLSSTLIYEKTRLPVRAAAFVLGRSSGLELRRSPHHLDPGLTDRKLDFLELPGAESGVVVAKRFGHLAKNSSHTLRLTLGDFLLHPLDEQCEAKFSFRSDVAFRLLPDLVRRSLEENPHAILKSCLDLFLHLVESVRPQIRGHGNIDETVELGPRLRDDLTGGRNLHPEHAFDSFDVGRGPVESTLNTGHPLFQKVKQDHQTPPRSSCMSIVLPRTVCVNVLMRARTVHLVLYYINSSSLVNAVEKCDTDGHAYFGY